MPMGANQRLILPKSFKPAGIKLGIKNRVLDVFVPQVALDGASVDALGCKLVAFGVPEHVGVDGKFDAGVFTY